MKRMIIVGNEHPDVDSCAWEDCLSLNISDYQIALIDFSTFQEYTKGRPLRDFQPLMKHVNNALNLLFISSHTVIILLPVSYTGHFPFAIDDLHIELKTKSGKTVQTSVDDKIIKFYKKYVSTHEVIFQRIAYQESRRIEVLMYNNVKEPLSVLIGSPFIICIHLIEVNIIRLFKLLLIIFLLMMNRLKKSQNGQLNMRKNTLILRNMIVN